MCGLKVGFVWWTLSPANFSGKKEIPNGDSQVSSQNYSIKRGKKQQHELVDIVNIALSSNVIGLEDHVFSPNWLPVM